MAFYSLEPWGTEVEDLRAGIVASVVANANRDPKKQRKPFKPQDFMPQWERHNTDEQTPEEQRKVIEMWNALLGGKTQG